MMKVLVINGVNLNMLGIREVDIYGANTYRELLLYLKTYVKNKKIKAHFYQSNSESKIVRKIQKAYQKYDGIVINPGAYAHYSIAILDALRSVNIPYVEVHLSDINKRENYRHQLITNQSAIKTIVGKSFAGYLEAIDELMKVVGE